MTAKKIQITMMTAVNGVSVEMTEEQAIKLHHIIGAIDNELLRLMMRDPLMSNDECLDYRSNITKPLFDALDKALYS